MDFCAKKYKGTSSPYPIETYNTGGLRVKLYMIMADIWDWLVIAHCLTQKLTPPYQAAAMLVAEFVWCAWAVELVCAKTISRA